MLKKFLAGKFNTVLEEISQKMNDASEEMEYEKAQVYRDQLVVLENFSSSKL